MPKVTFNNQETHFYSTVKLAVDEYFRSKNLKRTGNTRLYLKTITLVPSAVVLYLFFVVFYEYTAISIIAGGLFGFFLAVIGFNIMHDACHGSYSNRKWVNSMMSYTLNALGGNAFIWKFKHNILHHTYPNVDGMDDDIAKSPLIRQCETQQWVPMHKFQHIYIVLVYAITSFAWVFVMDFNKYFSRKVGRTALQEMNAREHLIFWASKVMYALVYVVVPVYFAGWQHWVIWFASFHLVMGFTLAIVFQLAHVVENTSFEWAGPNDPVKIESEWAEHQVKATADFATGNGIVSWFIGGLNFQVEHHLFPRISHVHYPALSKIVKETCVQHHIVYNEFPTMGAAIASHFKMMKALGKPPLLPVSSAI